MMSMNDQHVPASEAEGRFPRWLTYLNAVAALVVLGVVVLDPGFLCCVPLVGLVLATFSTSFRAQGAMRVLGIGVTVLFGIVLFNLANLAIVTRPIRALGGRVYTSGDGMADVGGPAEVRGVDLVARTRLTDSDLEKLRPTLLRCNC